MTAISELDLPDLPIETPEFSTDPMRFLTPAREKHPWLAKFRAGYVIHGLQAGRDLLAMDNRMGPHFHGVVEHFGAEGTEWARFMSEQIATTSGQADAAADARDDQHAARRMGGQGQLRFRRFRLAFPDRGDVRPDGHLARSRPPHA